MAAGAREDSERVIAVRGSREDSERVIAVRDSKDPAGPRLTFTPAEWEAPTAAMRDGQFGSG